MFKRHVLAVALGATVASLSGVAYAADAIGQDYSYNEPVAFNNPASFDGNYVGAQIGASSSRFPDPFSNRTGALMGIVAGKTIQNGNFVYGGEVEANFAEAEHRIGRGGSLQQSWNGVAKAKAGYAMDKTLVYGTLGYGVTRFKAKGNTTKAPGWEGGVQLGAGVEQIVSGPISVKAEYDYSRFSGVKSDVSGVGQKNTLGNHALKAGVNYRF